MVLYYMEMVSYDMGLHNLWVIVENFQDVLLRKKRIRTLLETIEVVEIGEVENSILCELLPLINENSQLRSLNE